MQTIGPQYVVGAFRFVLSSGLATAVYNISDEKVCTSHYYLPYVL